MTAPRKVEPIGKPTVNGETGLPANVDVERLVLGSILLDDEVFPDGLRPDHFSIEPHRRIWRGICDLRARGERVDRVTIANELKRRGELEHCNGLGYLVSLDDGLPRLPKIGSYVAILDDLATRRRIMHTCQNLVTRASMASEDLHGTIAAGQDLFSTITPSAPGQYRSVDEIPRAVDCGSGDVEYVRVPELVRFTVTAVTGGPGDGKSTYAAAVIRDAYRDKGIPSLVLDRENPLAVVIDRLGRLGMAEQRGVHFWGGWLPHEAPEPDHPVIREWIKENRGILVIDSWSAYVTSDQNDAGVCRSFMHRLRRIADAGGTVLVLHHTGKSESSADYRGSSDFKAAIDAGFHLSNFGPPGKLDKLVLRPFKARLGCAGAITYSYDGGKFTRADCFDARAAVNDQLRSLLEANPGVTSRRFDELVTARGIARLTARAWLNEGILARAIRRETGPKRVTRHFLQTPEFEYES